jgi:hypothetical protein
MVVKAGAAKTRNWAISSIALLIVFSATLSCAQSTSDSLLKGFENPPATARPLVWWHWMNGNVTKEGIKLDLEWMHRVGIAGFQNFDGSMATPKVVDQRLVYMTPEWKDAFKYAITLADQLGLEGGIAGSPGWSETGGPWVPAKEAMKKYVWSELRIQGGRPFSGTLPHPPSNTGAFQDLPVDDAGNTLGMQFHAPDYYADSSVIAYKVPNTDAPIDSLHPVVSSSSPIDLSLLNDGNLVNTTHLALPEKIGYKAWVQYEFAEPQAMRAVTLVTGRKSFMESFLPPGTPSGRAIEASDDGKDFHVIADLPSDGTTEHTVSFAPVTAKYFRVTFAKTSPPANPFTDQGFGGVQKSATEVPIAELVLHPGARVNRFEEKAGFKPMPDLYGFATPAFDQQDAISKSDVIDLTGKMRPDGTLEWTPPPGQWVVLRIGYSLLGIINHPASKEATGLEVDKLNSTYVRNYMNAYLASFQDVVGPSMMGKRGIRTVVNDSWEAGTQNWTDNMIEEFTKRRGYDPHPWLPVLAGHIVESAQESDQFLWDLRKTIADLTADEHFGQVEASLKELGIAHYGESHEGGRAFIADGMEVKKMDDVPMGAMWARNPGVYKTDFDGNTDDRESASVAHIYGQNLAAAESMTTCNTSSAWAWSPATLKPIVDMEFLNGINRIVIHESAHQPLTDKVPGITLGPCGQWFNRNETWAEQAGPWITYLGRSSYMLQQGRFAADLIYFYGEDSNLTAIYHTSGPAIPTGYNFDYVNADALMHVLKVGTGGFLTTPGGTSYRLLGLAPYSRHMSLPVLRAIHQLVMDGATVAGPKPIDDPSLADNQSEFQTLVNDLFGDGHDLHHVGKGTVYAGSTVAEALAAMRVPPDFDYAKPERGADLQFIHRKLLDGDIYFVDNRSDNPAHVKAAFRVTGRVPQLWRADTGEIAPVSYSIADGRTTIPLDLEPWGIVFVVFGKPATERSHTIPETVETRVATVSGPWNVAFMPDRGEPSHVTFDKLISWSDSPDKGIKHFSGEGTYTTTIQAEANWFGKHSTLWIDLGDVKNLAVVTVNGKELGTVWHVPYRVDATSAMKAGANQISVKVINSWVNRLIGDQQPDATTKYTFTTWKSYKATSPLLASGLIGPVSVVEETKKSER